MNTKHRYWWLLCISLSLFSCESDNTYSLTESEQITPVVFNFNDVPYETLSQYNFFEGDLKELNPVYGVLPYDLNSTLFTDYAKKKRFVWMPEGVQAMYVDDHSALDFPVGTVLIKNFYYDNVMPDLTTKIIETRLMFRLDDSWSFANYLWNDEQTEAYFTTETSFHAFDWLENGDLRSVNYKVPRLAECFTCHNIAEVPIPIGPKPQNLNRFFQYENENVNQLKKWIDQGYLNADVPENIVSTVDWKDPSQQLDLRVRSYLDINCAHCHSDESYCEYPPMRFQLGDYTGTDDLGVCVENSFYVNEDIEYIIKPGNANKSALYFRVATEDQGLRMPLIGRTLVDEEGVAMLEQWINSLDINCN